MAWILHAYRVKYFPQILDLSDIHQFSSIPLNFILNGAFLAYLFALKTGGVGLKHEISRCYFLGGYFVCLDHIC